jgi:glycerophosphoryl diester phosphodiesterase
VKIIGHRGACGYAPENTFASFDLALTLGADGLETDIHRTRDGELVLTHDDRVDRTTNGQGLVSDLTLAEIKALDAGNWFGPSFAGQRIPSLDEFLARYAGRTPLLDLEIKAPDVEQQVVEAVKRHGAVGTAILKSFNFDWVKRASELLPKAASCWLTYPFDEAIIQRAKEAGFTEIGPAVETATPELVAYAHSLRLLVRGWKVGSKELMRRAYALGFDGFSIDWPDWPAQEGSR